MASRTSRAYGAAPSSRPLERPGSASEKTEYDAAVRAEFEDAAQQRQFDLRTEPTVTPPGEKNHGCLQHVSGETAFGSRLPMTSLHTSQGRRSAERATPSADACPPGNNASVPDDLLDRPATGPEDRPLSSRLPST